MTTSAKIIADSISEHGIRLTTLQTKAPKFLDAEFEKHRMISSNSSSDRAIPLLKMLDNGYYLPDDIRLNQPGMQGDLLLDEYSKEEFWNDLKDLYGYTANILKKWDRVHKQHLNRYLLGFAWQSKVITATEWQNFFNLRIHNAADPAMYSLAKCIKEAMDESIPKLLRYGEWYLPYVPTDIQENGLWDYIDTDCPVFNYEKAIKCSVARCARTSGMNHDKSNPIIEDDLDLAASLFERPYINKKGKIFTENDPKHMSPFEHQATPMDFAKDTYELNWEEGVTRKDRKDNLWSANFRGWIQYRQLI